MAQSTILKRVVRRVAKALTDFARDKGWAPEDYRIYYRVNEVWDQVHFIFVAKAFESRSDFENYAEVRAYLEKSLADDPGLLKVIGLAVRSLSQVEKGGMHSIGPEYKEFWTFSRST